MSVLATLEGLLVAACLLHFSLKTKKEIRLSGIFEPLKATGSLHVR